jgi:hypothetical protein
MHPYPTVVTQRVPSGVQAAAGVEVIVATATAKVSGFIALPFVGRGQS